MKSYDLIVIGSGPAGERGAALAAELGVSVAMIEREVVPGGAGVNTGTVPSKTLRESALHLSGFRQRGLHGVDMSMRPNITVSDFMQRKREVVEKEWDLIEENMRWHNIDRYRGHARFASPHEVVVDTSGYDMTLHGEVILIATGSSPYRSPEVPFDDVSICDSDTILNLDCIPKTMAVVGAGVIGCEYASIFAALGIDVTLIDGRTELLSNVDREIVDVLMRQMRNRLRIQLQTGQDVESLACEDAVIKVKLKSGREIMVEKVLYAAGRQSNTADLGLDEVGVVTGKRGILPVNENYQTNVPHIYAAGDVIGFPALASTSMEQARVAMVCAFDLKHKTKLAALLPYGIYTIPEISMIGETEEQCLEKGVDYEVGRAYYRNTIRGQIMGDTAGMIKIVFVPGQKEKERRLLGIHIIGDDAAELIHVGMMVMQLGGTLSAFTQSVFNIPTLGDIYKQAAYDGLSRLKRRQRQKDLVLSQATSMARRFARRQREKQNQQAAEENETPAVP
ncbi:MAG TPA: Si-specific NAD(P)(+) transhydrogenase [Abditibacteriaceae bacterium]|nr:Si-specific NAD(P)(+) transhydrogenase [Abditibacteriaceae bacterium]